MELNTIVQAIAGTLALLLLNNINSNIKKLWSKLDAHSERITKVETKCELKCGK